VNQSDLKDFQALYYVAVISV